MKLITKQAEPNEVSVHALIVALVLGRKEESTLHKITKLLELICFTLPDGSVSQQELQYIFYLMYNWIEVSTQFKLKESEIQKRIEKTVYNEDNFGPMGIEAIAQVIDKEQEIAQLFSVFTKESRATNPYLKDGNDSSPNQSRRYESQVDVTKSKTTIGDGSPSKDRGDKMVI